MIRRPSQLRRRRFGDFLIDRLALKLANAREACELHLIAAILPAPRAGLATAREEGIDASSLIRFECQLCWDAIDLLEHRGRLTGDIDADREVVLSLICGGYRQIYPALWVHGTWGSVWTRAQQWNHLLTSAHWSERLVDVLFDVYPPCQATVRRECRKLVDLTARGRDAMEHVKYACMLLRGEAKR